LADQARKRDQGADLNLVHSSPSPAETPRSGGPNGRTRRAVAFNRFELATLLNLYGRKVAEGEWRDYALDFLKDRAMFSVYRRNSERPIFVIEKNPKLRNRQGQYLVSNMQGRVLKRGHELGQVLRVLDAQFVVIK